MRWQRMERASVDYRAKPHAVHGSGKKVSGPGKSRIRKKKNQKKKNQKKKNQKKEESGKTKIGKRNRYETEDQGYSGGNGLFSV